MHQNTERRGAIREIKTLIMQGSVLVKYQPGKNIIADGWTKVLQHEKLREARDKLLLQDVTK
eukprot:12906340-Prorocentrum_lima.AAC.1